MQTGLRIIYLVVFILFLASCGKNDKEVQPAIDITGSWQLEARMPFPDTTWLPVSDKDSSYYVFAPNGSFVFDSKHYHATGTYKVIADGSRIKLITSSTDSVTQYLQIERAGPAAIRVDDWLKGFAKGYSSRRFIRIAEQ